MRKSIRRIEGLVGGAPVIDERRITAYNVLMGAGCYDTVDEYLEEFGISNESFVDCINYCHQLRCVQEAKDGLHYCEQCTLFGAQHGQFDLLKEVIRGEDGLFSVSSEGYSNQIEEEMVESVFGFNGWIIADYILKRLKEGKREMRYNILEIPGVMHPAVVELLKK